MKKQRKRGRPVTRTLPEPRPDTPENIAGRHARSSEGPVALSKRLQDDFCEAVSHVEHEDLRLGRG